jgi:hypothetical protein
MGLGNIALHSGSREAEMVHPNARLQPEHQADLLAGAGCRQGNRIRLSASEGVSGGATTELSRPRAKSATIFTELARSTKLAMWDQPRKYDRPAHAPAAAICAWAR